MIEAALAQAMQQDRGRLLAALIARTGDFQRAEDALQDAVASAPMHWGRAGVPASPAVAYRQAIALASSAADRALLASRLAALG